MNHYFSKTFLLMVIIFAFGQNSQSQFRNYPLKIGLSISAVDPYTEYYESRGLKWSSYTRGYLRFELSDKIEGEFGGGYLHLAGIDRLHQYYSTNMYPVDFRLIYNPFEFESWNPYISAGLGVSYWKNKYMPGEVSPMSVDKDGYSGLIPMAMGAEFKLTNEIFLNLNIGYTHSLTSGLNAYKDEESFFKNDGAFNLGAGFTFAISPIVKDRDFDGLTNAEEEKLGTDPDNPDSDGDGLKDNEEAMTYHTNPMKADTDGDGLTDNLEVLKYRTSPLEMDTDGDRLSDGEELLKFKTNPTMTDTDGDKLTDGEEVLTYRTNPLDFDTDKDSLTDFDEVQKYHSNPLLADTDGGGKKDGDEVKAGTDLLQKEDDIDKVELAQKPAETTEPVKEEVFNLEGVLFATNSSKITSQWQMILEKDAAYLMKNPNIKIQVNGHTDSLGKLAGNMRLSERRAAAVKDWLVKAGISGDRITIKGFGPKEPAASNDNNEGRKKNRRADLKKADF